MGGEWRLAIGSRGESQKATLRVSGQLILRGLQTVSNLRKRGLQSESVVRGKQTVAERIIALLHAHIKQDIHLHETIFVLSIYGARHETLHTELD